MMNKIYRTVYVQFFIHQFRQNNLISCNESKKVSATKTNPKAYFALLTGLFLIGFSPVLIKMASAPGIITSFYRLASGAFVLTIPFAIHQFKTKQKIPLKGVLFAVLAGACFASDMAFWTTGIMASNATLPTLTGNMAPLWVGIGGWLIFKEKQHTGFWIGLLLAFGGVTMLIVNNYFNPDGSILKGMVLGIFSGMFYGGYCLLAQPGRKYLNTISFLYISTVATTLLLGIYGIIFKLDFTGYETRTWVLFLIMGVFMQAIAWFLITYSQGYLPASVVSPTLLGQPVLAAFLAFFIIGEELTLRHIIGGLIVVAGIYMVHFSKKKN
jgi:drug/metabolite transporter (DMT)-like permease